MATVQTKVPTTVTATTNEPKLTARAKEVLRVLYLGKTRNGENAKVQQGYKSDVYLDHIVDANITKDVSCTRLTFDTIFQLGLLTLVERTHVSSSYGLSSKGKELCEKLFGGEVVAKVIPPMTPVYFDIKIREYLGQHALTLPTTDIGILLSMLIRLDISNPNSMIAKNAASIRDAWNEGLAQQVFDLAYSDWQANNA